jgi:hypothetical protein
MRTIRSAIGKAIYAWILLGEQAAENEECKIRFARAKAEILAGVDPCDYAMMLMEGPRKDNTPKTPSEQAWRDYIDDIDTVE